MSGPTFSEPSLLLKVRTWLSVTWTIMWKPTVWACRPRGDISRQYEIGLKVKCARSAGITLATVQAGNPKIKRVIVA